MHLLQDRPKVRSAFPPRPGLVGSIDAAFAFIAAAPRLSSDFVENVLLTIGVQAEAVEAGDEVAATIRDALVSLRDRASMPTLEMQNRLLDVRLAARRAEVADARS